MGLNFSDLRGTGVSNAAPGPKEGGAIAVISEIMDNKG
jgi:hypothetical protein